MNKVDDSLLIVTHRFFEHGGMKHNQITKLHIKMRKKQTLILPDGSIQEVKRNTFSDVINQYLIKRFISYFLKRGTVIKFDTIKSTAYWEKFFIDRQFVHHHNGWLVNGFVYARVLSDKIEIKTESSNQSMYISTSEQSIKQCIEYLSPLIHTP